jgi:hypothetical protein
MISSIRSLVYCFFLLNALLIGPLYAQSGSGRGCGAMHLETSDVSNFWRAFDIWQTQDKADPSKLEALLQHEYLDKGTPGLAAFIPHRIVSAKALAETVAGDVDYYREVRPITLSFSETAPRLLEVCKAMQTIYPDVRVPTVYLVIGRENSGGTSGDSGLIIGAEMFSPRASARIHANDFVPLVTHELVHYQQRDGKDPSMSNTLLRAAIVEGAADFIAERLAGKHIDETAKPYADSHEQELWESFKKAMLGNATKDWLYNQSQVKDGVPPDLGYYEGYKICQSFFENQPDKPAALRQILLLDNVTTILAQSHYSDRFH